MAMKAGERIGIIMLFLFALSLAAFMLIFIVDSRKRERREKCRMQLGQVYLALTFPPTGWEDTHWKETPPGPGFWPAWRDWSGPPRGFLSEWLCCPVLDRPEKIDYRAPVRAVNEMADDDPIVSDRPGNHGPDEGGNVLLKKGVVREAGKSEAIWKRASETTQ